MNNIPPDLQHIAPVWARFCLEIDKFVQSYLQIPLQGRNLLLGLSGGVDSTALLLLCHFLKKRWQSNIFAAYLDHGLREEAKDELLALGNLCQRLQVPYFTGSSKVMVYAAKFGLGIEEAARILRYRFLLGLARKKQLDMLLLAHHLNDLAEDMLMRLLRGTGWPGLSGMQAWEEQNAILRPFLLTSKDDLIAFVEYMGISWHEDRTNLDMRFMRNRVRHNILPLLLQENPNYLANTAQLWRQAQVDRAYWQEQLSEWRAWEQKREEAVLLPANKLQKLHAGARLRWYKDVLQRLGSGQALSTNLFQLEACWDRRAYGKMIQFPGGKWAEVTKTGVFFGNACNRKQGK